MELFLYESTRGEKYVETFISVLDSKTQAKVMRSIDLLQRYGFQLGMPHSKKISARLFELRILGTNNIRIFYGTFQGDIYLLHAFTKKGMKIPAKELSVSQARLESLEIVD